MTRFGRLFLGLLILVVIAFASMLRWQQAEEAPAPASAPPPPAPMASAGPLTVPVAGVQPEQLADTFRDPRTGHVHGAIDIMAPRGTPVVAAMPGTVEKLFESAEGGTTAYLRSPDGRWVAYYAHLDGYAPGLREGLYVQKGAPVGQVGFTGNASAEGPHLHFALKRMEPGEAWHEGRAVNPYPLLRGVR
ncbi:M23 family metallopeptidase [Sphingomonas jatrophae]|uniref:Peptidase family M23 n=1 Tax=Sphingomonas jatrophae TaxID=1166337 RepID=A0A1I6JZQ0_9SPHN|nr:M23 family metallopeptidase [Sphingomonas jatrophae]SFR84433.1 Peptidase family M23 [Sphingomonas jatrophae]